MYNILHVMAGADAGGISMVVLNYYKYLDHNRYHFDVAITSDHIGMNGEKLIELGAKIYFLPLKSEGIKKYKKALSEILDTNQYDCIHVHENETSYVALSVAKKHNISRRIAHSHTTSPSSSLKNELRRLSGCFLNGIYSTNMVGCGELAGRRVFGNHNFNKGKVIVLPNGIETKRFSYNQDVRNNVRNALNLEQNFVVGMVGRIDYQKNNIFAIEIFKQIHKNISTAKLVIAGNGPDENALKDAISSSGLTEEIIMLGRRSDVDQLYQAFDIFLLPSRFEGFPVAAVEALSSGLPVLLSNTITKELSFGSAVEYLPLDNVSEWVSAALKYTNDPFRSVRQREVLEQGLDIMSCKNILMDIYEGRRDLE